MKKSLILLTSAVLTGGALLGSGTESFGQGAARVREELGRTEFGSGASVEVHMSDATAATIAAADINPSRTTATVYGVRLFSDNSQNARENARAAAAIFTELQPGIPVEVTYQIPHFFVTAGLFIDRTEAVALSGRVLTQFKSAMVVQREVPLLEVIAAERIELTEPEEKDAQEAGGAGIIGSGGGGNTTVDSLRVTEKPRVF